MPHARKSLQPRSFEAFRCIGAACEDTCCDGWAVAIDRQTYEKYRHCADPELKPLFDNLVTLNTGGADDDYARIALSGSHCPALQDGLCSVQNRLGEEYLSKTCLTYPRVVNQVDEVLQRSLHLSCPEAARLVLLDPSPIDLQTTEREQDIARIGNLVVVDTSKPGQAGNSYRHFGAVQHFVLDLLRNRSYPLWKRLVILGYLCERLDELISRGNDREIPAVIQGYTEGLQREAFEEVLSRSRPQPLLQLETALELIVGRISSDFTNRRFLECYEQFMRGLDWTSESSMTDLERRYTGAYSHYYAPFMHQHEYIVDNYLVNYAYKTLFPFGPQQRSRESILPSDQSASSQYTLLIAYYAIIRTVLVGIAAFHKESFASSHVVQLIYAASRTFEHSFSYPERIIRTLAEKGLKNPSRMAALILN